MKKTKEIVKGIMNNHAFYLSLGFVLGAIIPAYVMLLASIKGLALGDVGEWVGSIATVAALIMVFWQVQRSEKNSSNNMQKQFDHQRLVKIADSRPRFKINVITHYNNAAIDSNVSYMANNIQYIDISKRMIKYPKNHSFIEIKNLLGSKLIKIDAYFEFKKAELNSFIQGKSPNDKLVLSEYLLGSLTTSNVLLIPPTAYEQKGIFDIKGHRDELKDYRYTRTVFRFTTLYGEEGFAEIVNKDYLKVGSSGMLGPIKYYFVNYSKLESISYGDDQIINRESKKYTELSNLFK